MDFYTTIFKRIAGICFYSKSFMLILLIHQLICLNELYKLMESFFSNSEIIFELAIGQTQNILKDSEESILLLFFQ